MKTKLLKRLRREAKVEITPPMRPYGIYVYNYFVRERVYILRRVAELKQKRK